MQQRLAAGIDSHLIEASAELDHRAGRETALDGDITEADARKARQLLKYDA
ncbi:hypothetical protein D3C81_2043950 [compost metagenome]